MIRTIVMKPFNTGDPTPVAIVSETYADGTVVEYPKSAPRMVLNVDKPQFLADGVDAAALTTSFEECALIDGELVWTAVAPTGDVTFVVNLRPTIVTINGTGTATLTLSSTVEKRFQVRASHPAYGEAYGSVEALL